jgi:hypothetical protein
MPINARYAAVVATAGDPADLNCAIWQTDACGAVLVGKALLGFVRAMNRLKADVRLPPGTGV